MEFANPMKVVNVSSVPQRSPFRYPGGKTWLVPRFQKWIRSLDKKPAVFVEPFAGGGIISLTVAMEDLADRVVMCEIDPSVAAVWRVILQGDYRALIGKILRFEIDREGVVRELSRQVTNDIDVAFQTILRNRVQRGGILAPGASLVKNGENGKGVASRWYPGTLARRIEAIATVRNKIEFHCADGFGIIRRFAKQKRATFFVDPPYTAGGKKAGSRLYAFNGIDHDELFRLVSTAHGSAMMTYDDALEPLGLAKRYGFCVEKVAMSNTHHNTMRELIITK